MDQGLVKKIKNDDQHQQVLARIGELMSLPFSADAPENDELEVLALLAAEYEKEAFFIEAPGPIEAIRFRMDQSGLSQRDLAPLIGSKSKTSEVLSGKRPLTLGMIRSLHRHLGIPLESLIEESQVPLADALTDVDWTRFPVREMVQRGFVTFAGPLNRAAAHAEELVRPFFSNPEGAQAMFCRARPRVGSAVNQASLSVWQNQVFRLAAEESLGVSFDRTNLDDTFLAHLATLSQYQGGPRLAREHLARVGVHLVELAPLKKTFLDGAAMLRANGNPVIALTYRHARVDNFWFTLFHELGHVVLHLGESQPGGAFLDDLDVGAGEDRAEREADDFAVRHLYPAALSEWASRLKTWNDVVVFAGRHLRHPAVIAGRLRHLQGNYKLFGRIMAQQLAEHVTATRGE
ncbi:MAG: hypothetical protein CVU65_08270 [Deltaproteobacteria bacterium HGW-Deltaproteobacteria-22]|jgi:HTH-type transcriptional regulator/antitoxin HigA|nr:MAG: hypothetical protein CVU65_08270 [Deltaproteobacteria bacterium HGW-Deltaproteobacteria-22]